MPHHTPLIRFPSKAISIFVLAALWFMGSCNLTWGDEEPLPEILILNSYHQGEDWSDNELAGIISTLKKRHPFLVPSVEHLDTKRFSKPEHLAFIGQYLHNKYQGKRFDLIFVLDNPALDLMTKARHELFPGIPVVLAGINGYTPEMIRGQDRIAGVAEVQDMAGTLKLALTLHPETKSVLMVHDYTASGLAVRRDMAAVAEQFKNKVNIAYTPDGTVEELVAQLQSLPADALVLLLTYVTDNSGRSLTRTESTRLITSASPVPVYAMHETRLGHGIIGGMLLEGKEHGRQAADIALRILTDKVAAQYVVEDSRSRPVFDHSQLVRFKVDLNKLPENSALINQPVSFFQQHRILLIPSLIVVVLLLTIIAILAFAVSRIRRTRNELATSEEKYRGLFATILDGLILADPVSRSFIEVNPAICTMTGYTTEEMRSLRVEDIHPEESLPHVLAQFEKQMRGEILMAPGLPIKRKNGEVFYADVHAIPVQIQGRQLFLSVFRDITERKQFETSLLESEAALKAILNASTETIFLMEVNGTILAANESLCKRVQTSLESLVGSDIYSYLPPALAAARRQHVQQAIETRQPHHFRDQRNGQITEHYIYPVQERGGDLRKLAVFAVDITERVQMEEALLHSQELLNSTQRLSHVGGWEWDVKKQVMSWTDETYRIHGFGRGETPLDTSELIQKGLGYYDADDRSVVLEAFNRCIEHGQPYNLQLQFTADDGRRLWVRTMATPVREGERIIKVVGNIADITERKQFENILLARLRLSEAASAFSQDALLQKVLDEAEALTGSCIGFFHFLENDQQTLSLQAWSTNTLQSHCRAEGTGLHYNVDAAGVWVDCIRQRRPVIHNDYAALQHSKGLPAGHAPVVRELVVPIFRGEKIVAIFGVGNKRQEYDQRDIELVTTLGDMVWDIVLRKQAEIALHKQEIQYRRFVDTAREGIWAMDSQRLTTYVNQHIAKLLGYTVEEMIGQPIEDFMFAEDLAGHFQRMAERRKGEGGNYEHRFLHKDGRAIWTIVSATALLDDQGVFQGSFAMFTDITERKRTEEHLAAALAEKEVLLREVHHRVKNNLAAIIGLMDMQRGIIDDPEGRGVLAELSDRIRSMSLVHEKLYRSESLANIDFHDYIQALVSHLRTSFGSPQIQCEVDAKGMEMPLDLAVPCGMIINELITNALKYAFPQTCIRPGKETCRIRVTAGCDHGNYTLSVADNGVGIPPGFDWTKAKTLGLLLVRMLGQHQLGGSFELDSSGGTRFSLTFTERKRKT